MKVFCGENKIGELELLDWMGDDNRVVDTARVSFAKEASQFTNKQNKGLIDYLYRNLHTSPFEQVVMHFYIKMPIFVARQMVRHRTIRLNEVSRRYIDTPPEYYSPEIRPRANNVKQGSGEGTIQHHMTAIDKVEYAHKIADETYKELLSLNVAPEIARGVLPLNTMTEWKFQIDLHNLFHFLKLRTDEHAQKEIRVFAEAILNEVKRKNIAPMSIEVFEKYLEMDFLFRDLKNAHKDSTNDLIENLKKLL